MKIAGIVAEYNPFHNGHAHHIQQTRAQDGRCRATHVVAVMSGHFVQRGEPALLPKPERSAWPWPGGADLVLELPLPWSLASAEGFAYGAVSILDALGCVEVISFGSECGDAAALEKAAAVLEEPRFGQLLRFRLEEGISFPEARQKAVADIAGQKTAALFSSPNNTLGIEYLKAAARPRLLSAPLHHPPLRRGARRPAALGGRRLRQLYPPPGCRRPAAQRCPLPPPRLLRDIGKGRAGGTLPRLRHPAGTGAAYPVPGDGTIRLAYGSRRFRGIGKPAGPMRPVRPPDGRICCSG